MAIEHNMFQKIPVQTLQNWNKDYNLSAVREYDDDRNNQFNQSELDALLYNMGINNEQERNKLIKHILQSNYEISAKQLMKFFDTDNNDVIEKDEVQITKDIINSDSHHETINIISHFFNTSNNQIILEEDYLKEFINNYQSLTNDEKQNAKIILEYVKELIIKENIESPIGLKLIDTVL